MKINLEDTNWRYYQFFDNGYGVSVVNLENGFKTGNNLELAVLKGNKYTWEICYDTPITGDVVKNLTEKELIKTINDVKSLPKEREAVK